MVEMKCGEPITLSGGGGQKYSARRSPPWPFWALKRAESRSSSKSSSSTSPGVKTLPASNSSFFSCFFRFFGRSSTCCCIGCLQFCGIGIQEIDTPPRSVVHDQHGPIDHLDIEGVAQLPTEVCSAVIRRLLNRALDRLVIRDPVEQPGALPLVEQGPVHADFRVLLAGHHLDVGAGLLLERLLDRVVPVEPLDPACGVLRSAPFEVVQDLLERAQGPMFPLVLDEGLDLLEVVPLHVDRRHDGPVLELDLPLFRIPDLHVAPDVLHGILDPRHVGERSEEHTSELQSRLHLVCRLLLEKKKQNKKVSGQCIYHR